ncbi:ABC-2 transporter permease [uncultured Peptoniphilus sp.]|uniref:ABC-2 transporter permease n=1 Tax=uncultured Peptoniphilus sp. TaxID=254354 RepID=UPI002804CE34|nr:ABC-2 transporter permease [uncultured Peptoniphilus sp.]
MRGLFSYYINLSKRRFLLFMSLLIIVILISIFESAHELVLLYLGFLPTILLAYSYDQKYKKFVFERLIPVNARKIMITQYLVIIFYSSIGCLFSLIYLLILKKIDINLNFNEQIANIKLIMLFSISLNISILISSLIKKKMYKIFAYGIPVIQALITFKDNIEILNIYDKIKFFSQQNIEFGSIIVTILFILISLPISYRLYKNYC